MSLGWLSVGQSTEYRVAMTIATSSRGWMECASACGDATHPERCVISVVDGYLSIAARDQRISTVSEASKAWVFHTHEKAVTTARELARLTGRLHEVVQLR
jgi:hypothetical protein